MERRGFSRSGRRQKIAAGISAIVTTIITFSIITIYLTRKEGPLKEHSSTVSSLPCESSQGSGVNKLTADESDSQLEILLYGRTLCAVMFSLQFQIDQHIITSYIFYQCERNFRRSSEIRLAHKIVRV
ncbi:hypothetical protein OIU79_002149 [Salix purpurea]|uniref:Uncharacterized protein n=1 Tax=Salix purpurea TaxID=77065 RepID=A0A9Q0URI8_SALPP|nr:hypothetical protein OIU79_002149 [Salix purpurea]